MTRLALAGIAAGLVAFGATAALALTRTGGKLGPEGVPIPAGRTLADPRPLAPGEQIDGIACQAREQVRVHIHAHLTIVVRGVSRKVPAGIGIARPYESRNAFVVAAPCFSWLHTHAADGIIHVESPTLRTYTLGDFFDVWGASLDRGHVGPARGAVTAYVNGRRFQGDPRRIPLLAHAQIQLDVGRPLVAPETIAFPNGL